MALSTQFHATLVAQGAHCKDSSPGSGLQLVTGMLQPPAGLPSRAWLISTADSASGCPLLQAPLTCCCCLAAAAAVAA